MMKLGNNILLVLILIIFFSSPLVSQANLKIGYTANFFNSEVNNSLIDRYNEDRPWLEAPMQNVHLLHGIQLGVRYKINVAAVEFTWDHSSRSRSALGEDPINSQFMEKKLFYSMNTLSLGLQNDFGSFGYGATIDRRTFRVKTNIGNTDNKRSIISQSGWSSKFYLSLNVQGGDFVSLSIQPFVQVPWEAIDFSNLESDLHEGTGNIQEPITEKFIVYGLSFVFYNGAQ